MEVFWANQVGLGGKVTLGLRVLGVSKGSGGEGESGDRMGADLKDPVHLFVQCLHPDSASRLAGLLCSALPPSTKSGHGHPLGSAILSILEAELFQRGISTERDVDRSLASGHSNPRHG